MKEQDLQDLFKSAGLNWDNCKIHEYFDELDLLNNNYLTPESLVSTQGTKKGSLYVYNLITLLNKDSKSNENTVQQFVDLECFYFSKLY